MSKGTHYIEVALNEVPLFIKDGRQIELWNFTARHNRHSYDSVKFYLCDYLFAQSMGEYYVNNMVYTLYKDIVYSKIKHGS